MQKTASQISDEVLYKLALAKEVGSAVKRFGSAAKKIFKGKPEAPSSKEIPFARQVSATKTKPVPPADPAPHLTERAKLQKEIEKLRKVYPGGHPGVATRESRLKQMEHFKGGSAADRVLAKLAAQEDVPIVGPYAASMGLTGAGIGGMMGAMSPGGRVLLPALVGGGIGAGVGAGLGAAVKYGPHARFESGFRPHKEPGAGEMYGSALGAGTGALSLMALPQLMEAHPALGILPIAATIGGGVAGGYLGSRADR